ncbi:MAG: large conductance mechanosensitive channel protein MscL [Pseudomonadota bacterium]
MAGNFREFILRGNVVDLSVGVVIGAAFGNLVSKFTESFVNPLIRLATGGVEFGGKIVLIASPDKSSEIALSYGNFVTALVTFLITAVVVYYAVVLPLGRLNERLGLAPKGAAPTPQEQLLTEIRDLLKKG